MFCFLAQGLPQQARFLTTEHEYPERPSMSTIIYTTCGSVMSGIYFEKNSELNTKTLPNKLLQVFMSISVKSATPYLLKIVILVAIIVANMMVKTKIQ